MQELLEAAYNYLDEARKRRFPTARRLLKNTGGEVHRWFGPDKWERKRLRNRGVLGHIGHSALRYGYGGFLGGLAGFGAKGQRIIGGANVARYGLKSYLSHKKPPSRVRTKKRH